MPRGVGQAVGWQETPGERGLYRRAVVFGDSVLEEVGLGALGGGARHGGGKAEHRRSGEGVQLTMRLNADTHWVLRPGLGPVLGLQCTEPHVTFMTMF